LVDLGRVGIVPDPRYLGTKAARNLIPWAQERAVEWHVPQAVLASWGIESGIDPEVAEDFRSR
nr:hypothetical protein [Hydrogenophaga sp.]